MRAIGPLITSAALIVVRGLAPAGAREELSWELVEAGDRLSFRAQHPATGWELWALRP
jgi:hypothetical protein